MGGGRTRLAVWGDPIDHSRSPALHRAAYRALGLDAWEYGRQRVNVAGFAAALAELDTSWRGLSLTMPLKNIAFEVAGSRTRHAELTGAVNTLVLAGREAPAGANTDVGGIVRALRAAGVGDLSHARILGAGATAGSAVIASEELGARSVEIVARRPEQVRPLVALGERLGITVIPGALEHAAHPPVDLTISTLPGGASIAPGVAAALADAGGVLLDVAYEPWPSLLARAWQDRAGTALTGLLMLLEQAVLQVRLFVTGDVDTALDDEEAVVAAMRLALMGD